MQDSEREVAVIGAGPAGLAVARYLKTEGFDPVVYEQGPVIGGQWSGDRARSGVWSSMRTNTSRILTAFSDLPHPTGTATYPSRQDVGDYLRRYAETFDLLSIVRLGDGVIGVTRDASGRGWTVRTVSGERRFSRVVVATGAFRHGVLPSVAGLASFSGSGGLAHTFSVAEPAEYRGMRVLVAGGAISALEIAAELAMQGAHVTVTARRQRYVLPKLVAGRPTDHTVFTRFHALFEESSPAADVDRLYTDLAIRLGGNPGDYGARRPAATVGEAGLTLSQHFLPLVAEGRIDVRPWLTSIERTLVTFSDDSAAEFDAVLFGTGFELRLPFLDDDIRRTLDLDPTHIDLHLRTFHPDLPGLAFVGLWDQAGPYFPPIELQARMVAYSWSGAVPSPAPPEMVAGIAACRARRNLPQKTRMHVATVQFARAAGVEPELARWPALRRALLFGPLAPASFRLEGHDCLADAAARVSDDAAAFGCVEGDRLAPDQQVRLRELVNRRRDPEFTRIAEPLLDPAAPG